MPEDKPKMTLAALLRNPEFTKSFHNQVDRTAGKDACWLWTGSKGYDGYGLIGGGGKLHRANRIAFMLIHGAMPSSVWVLHSCHERLCVNPRHLRAGDHISNMQDMRESNRGWRGEGGTRANGRHKNSKLTQAQVDEIRSTHKPGVYGQKQLAKKFGVGKTQIARILKGERWPVRA